MGQLIWAIVVPMPGHLDVYSWSGGHCEGHHPGRKQTSDRNQQGTRDGRTKLPTAGLGSFADGFTDMD